MNYAIDCELSCGLDTPALIALMYTAVPPWDSADAKKAISDRYGYPGTSRESVEMCLHCPYAECQYPKCHNCGSGHEYRDTVALAKAVEKAAKSTRKYGRSIGTICKKIGISRSTYYRKIKTPKGA